MQHGGDRRKKGGRKRVPGWFCDSYGIIWYGGVRESKRQGIAGRFERPVSRLCKISYLEELWVKDVRAGATPTIAPTYLSCLSALSGFA